MRNPELTRQIILKTSGELFNTHGYKATSISNITDATGLTKGAIYKHFRNKDELEKETFMYLSDQVASHLGEKIRAENNAKDKLEVIFIFFDSYLTHPPVVGGCPLLNLAVEADDAHPDLKIQALQMMEMLRNTLYTILKNGIRYEQIIPGTDCEQVASVILASLEGGIMMGKLSGKDSDMRHILDHLRGVVKQLTV